MLGPFPVLTPIARGGTLLAEVWSRWLTSLVAQVNLTRSGNGDPNGAEQAPEGSLYLNLAGGATNTLWVKESGGTTSSGWVAK